MADQYNKIGMISAVRKYLLDREYELRPEYDPVLAPARVPIFACKSKPGGEGEEIFVDIITERKIKASNYFRDREISGLEIRNASSAQFFRHYFPNALVYWAIPDYLEKDSEFDAFLKHCKEEGIGLYEVKKNNKNILSVREYPDVTSQSLQEERIRSLFQAFERKSKSKLTKEQKKSIETILKRYSHEDISYLVFYPEPKYLAADVSLRDKKYNISRELVNRMSELKNISYKDTIFKFSDTYNSRREDDYQIAYEVTQELWKKYNLEYPKLHQDFEQILKRDPKYRDHFLHAFQVFLYGAYIIDKKYEQLCGIGYDSKVGSRIEDAWLIAATYHDYNYMIQKFEDWTQDFFKEALHLLDNVKIAQLSFGESYIKDGYMFKTKRLTDSLGLSVDDITLKFLYNKILVDRNHGIISGLSLLKYLDKNNHVLSEKVLDSACKAISIHDKEIWQFMSGVAKEVDKEIEENFRKKKVLPKLSFDEDPISFLLILSDTLQEQGRETSGDSKAELESVYFKNNEIFTEISFEGDDSKEAFDGKIAELTDVEKFLTSPKQFKIKVIDKTSDHSYELRIGKAKS